MTTYGIILVALGLIAWFAFRYFGKRKELELDRITTPSEPVQYYQVTWKSLGGEDRIKVFDSPDAAYTYDNRLTEAANLLGRAEKNRPFGNWDTYGRVSACQIAIVHNSELLDVE